LKLKALNCYYNRVLLTQLVKMQQNMYSSVNELNESAKSLHYNKNIR